MPVHFTIYKFNPETGEKIALHEKVPEQIVDWLCGVCERDLSPADEARGFVIMKESSARPVQRAVPSRARRAKAA